MKQIKMKTQEQKGEFSGMLLGVSLIGNLLTGKAVKRSDIPGQGLMQAGEGTIRTSWNF